MPEVTINGQVVVVPESVYKTLREIDQKVDEAVKGGKDFAQMIDHLLELLRRQPDNILHTMWQELESYQPVADANGHGDTWRTMCEEKTVEAADAAADAISWSAAAEAAAEAAAVVGASAAVARAAAHAIAAIRKAKRGAR